MIMGEIGRCKNQYPLPPRQGLKRKWPSVRCAGILFFMFPISMGAQPLGLRYRCANHWTRLPAARSKPDKKPGERPLQRKARFRKAGAGRKKRQEEEKKARLGA